MIEQSQTTSPDDVDRVFVRLSRDIQGLGDAGNIVLADPTQHAEPGDWSAIIHERGVACLRWHDGLPPGSKITKVVR